ncbi:amidase [Maliponia aquimaris]|jgi:aspartyl-tRNA(Asn)/glutamyl-tRNA(Gln) amidotransferase subunit A|uniref:Glutamyl-tRNA(Gln) amidotransferase subunit A n=1 Tax=Maliponia aquimaris TaxID=1673631 RepID=A0A238KVP5_9RHOB|nr:amidase [Maliponia aquimaris]SMX46252.1 Glutamyl-tRNA(Gln) amidotransferase subunit A [Maliponia aquimaris]
MTPLPDLGIQQAGRLLRDGRLTSVALTQAHLARIDDRNADIGAFVHIDRDGALRAAEAADAALAAGRDLGPLHGIPVAIKDIFDVAGWPVRYGTQLFAGRVAESDAACVSRLRAGGAVPIGLVATYELAIVGPGEDGLYDQPRNPWDRNRITGGSSSGAAAAIAAGMIRIALGSDTGGSVRSPSAYCGTVGLKPTRGLLPREGSLPLAPSFDTPGAMARTAAEAAVLHGVLAAEPCALGDTRRLDGLRIGCARGWAGGAVDPAVIRNLDAAASTLSLAGAEVTPVDLPDLDLMIAAAAVLIHAEGLATHAAHLKGDGGVMGRMAYQSMAAGAVLDDRDVDNARQAASLLSAELDAVLTRFDAILTPTALTVAPPFSDFAGGAARWTPMCTLPFNMTGHPALSVPMGFAGGMPLGLQIVGRRGAERTILGIGDAFEQRTDHGAFDAATLPPAPTSHLIEEMT